MTELKSFLTWKTINKTNHYGLSKNVNVHPEVRACIQSYNLDGIVCMFIIPLLNSLNPILS